MAVMNRKELVRRVVEASEVLLAAGLCVREKSLVAEAHRGFIVQPAEIIDTDIICLECLYREFGTSRLKDHVV